MDVFLKTTRDEIEADLEDATPQEDKDQPLFFINFARKFGDPSSLRRTAPRV